MTQRNLARLSRWLSLATLVMSGGICLMVSLGRDIHVEVFFYWALVAIRCYVVWLKEYIFQEEQNNGGPPKDNRTMPGASKADKGTS